MRRLLLALAVVAASAAAPTDPNIETAARIGVALMVCDISTGAGSHGWNDYIARSGLPEHAARAAVEARQREILSYLNRAGRLDEFCRNDRAGRV